MYEKQTVRLAMSKRRPYQTCWVFCPGCGKDLVVNHSYLSDVPGALVTYVCGICSEVSAWDFDTYGPFIFRVPNVRVLNGAA